MSAQQKGGAKTQQKQICLNQLSSLVMSIIKSKKTTTFQEVTDLVLAENSVTNNDKERTSRRRVYDVINVCVSAGIVIKEGKTLIYNPIDDSEGITESTSNETNEDKIEALQESITKKLQIFLLYKTLMERNQRVMRPPSSVQLPAIFVGFPSDKGVSSLSLDGKQLEIKSEQDPTFYSPVDVLKATGISIDGQREFLRSMPMFNRFESRLFPQEQPIQTFNFPPVVNPKLALPVRPQFPVV